MSNYLKISKLTINTILSTLLVTATIVKPSLANSNTQNNQKICKDNNGHGNNKITKLTEVKLTNIYLNDGTAYILDYAIGTIDPSNPSSSALNRLDIRVDETPVNYQDLLLSQINELLGKIKAVEDIELNGNKSTSKSCSSPDEANLPIDEPTNNQEEPDSSSEKITYSD